MWARTTTQSNSCQHPLPELLFSLITIMSRGMGRAGGGLSTHPQPKHRYTDKFHSLVISIPVKLSSFISLNIVIQIWTKLQAELSEHVPFIRASRNTLKKGCTEKKEISVSSPPVLQDALPWFNKSSISHATSNRKGSN